MRRVMLAASSGLALAVASPSAAQDMPADTQPAEAEAAGGDEIVVTARKREESLFEVPAAITAIAPQQIEDARLQDPRDLLTLVPTAYLQENNAGTARDISIRGVGTPTLFAEPGVALYVDDIYSSGFISFPTQFYDLERVEVLRGPQGALYGRNAVGGAVNIISARPTDELSGMMRATVARYDRIEAEAMANLPVTDSFAVRASGLYIYQDEGEYFNPTTGRFIDRTRLGSARAVARFKPSDAFTLNLIVEHTDAETPGTYLFFPSTETKKTVRRDTQPTNAFEVTRYAGELSYETAGAGTFTLVAGGRDYDLDGVEDTDLSDQFFPGSPNAPLGQQITTRNNEVRSRFAELRWFSGRMGPVEILGGVSYLDDDATGDILTDLRGLSVALAGGAVPFTLGIANDQNVKSWAGFVEVAVELAEAVELSGSLRYTEDDKSVDFLFTPSPALTGFVGPSQAVARSATFDNWSPGVTLSWQPDDWNLYAKVQTGFRAGGFNFNVANAANLPYDEETSINYEIGAKRRIAGGYVGVTAYVLEQDDVLVPFFDFTAPPGLQGFLANAGDARTVGVEAEASISPVQGVTLTGSVGYIDAKFRSGSAFTPGGAPLDLDGLRIPASRKWTYALTAAVKRPVADGIDFVANAAFTHRSGGFQDTANTLRFGDSDLLNASAGLDFGVIDIQAFVQNALDDDNDIAFGGARGTESGVVRAPGITYGASVRGRF